MDNIETKGLTPIVHNEENILEVNGLKKYFPIKGGFFNSVVGQVKALDGISFHIKRGTTMGLVGESGCGKTTAGRTILRLNGGKTAGEVLFNGKEVYDIPKNELNDLRVKMQIIFQDPFSSLSPRLPVGEIIGEAWPSELWKRYMLQATRDLPIEKFNAPQNLQHNDPIRSESPTPTETPTQTPSPSTPVQPSEPATPAPSPSDPSNGGTDPVPHPSTDPVPQPSNDPAPQPSTDTGGGGGVSPSTVAPAQPGT